MEYLTLQDIPQRHCHPVHSHRMSHSAERSLGNMAANPMRNSPPLQPGEQPFPGKLPSFDEFVQTTIERTPPHTPSRRNGSAEVSPRVRPQFDDVAWSDSKRKRVDTLGDIYASRPSNTSDYPPNDPRRVNSVIVDPALYQSQRQASAGPAPLHRPSLPFPALSSAAGHVRTQSTPHAAYQHTPPPPAHYQAHPPQPQITYEARRPSYYQEPLPPTQTYPYENHRDSYYARASFAGPSTHAGYEHGYPQAQYDVRFQQHVGLDHNAFNRKRRGNLPKEATNYLKAWFARNRQSPYPTEDQKIEMCRDTGLSLNQVSNWFINARRRAPGKDQRERDNNTQEK
jgi:hypothetical protein